MRKIHPTAIVSKETAIHDEAEVGPFCLVEAGVTLGKGVKLKSHVVVSGKTTIGDETVVYPFACLGQIPQDLKYNNEPSELVIGKNNVIREYVTMQLGTAGGGNITKVGDDCLFMVGTHIAHDCNVGNRVIFANYATLAGHVIVEDGAVIGGLAAIQQHVRVGSYSMVGGMSGIVRDLIPFGLATNDRAKLDGLNLVGIRRNGFSSADALEASKVLEELFLEKLC